VDEEEKRTSKALFGLSGLDDILGGGLARNRVYLLEGVPGSGKTTLAMQFLLEGASAGEKGHPVGNRGGVAGGGGLTRVVGPAQS